MEMETVQNSSASELVKAGSEHYKRREYMEAVTAYRSALAEDPSLADAHYWLGNALDKLHFPSDAISEYKTALSLDSSDFYAANSAACLIAAEGDFESAISVLEAAIAQSPDMGDIYFNYSRYLDMLGRSTEAVAAAHKAIELDPLIADYYASSGASQMHLGDLSAAIIDYTEALKLEPDNPEILNNYGCALLDNKDYQEALIVFGKAHKIDPYDPVYILNRGICHLYLDNFLEAFDDFTQLMSTDSHAAIGNLYASIALMQTFHFDEALQYIDAAIRIDPDLYLARFLAGSILETKGLLTDAVEQYKAAITSQASPSEVDEARVELKRTIQKLIARN